MKQGRSQHSQMGKEQVKSATRAKHLLHYNSEALSEPSSHLSPESRNLASLLCSKIYFYLGAINDAVNAALNAGDAFTRDHSEGMGEYKETIIGEFWRDELSELFLCIGTKNMFTFDSQLSG
jgi:hypothetical protein